jgi:hypothetical protein
MAVEALCAFNPRNTGLYEAEVWRAYYDRKWIKTLALSFQLLRSQFSLKPPAAARATFLAVRAAKAWAPVDHDRSAVGAMLDRFYEVLRRGTGADFDPHAAGAAELEYWAVHRDLSGQPGTAELIASLAAISVQVYGLTFEEARPAAVARARACDLVDEITAKKVAPTEERWSAIRETLYESYRLLSEALARQKLTAA